jgi:hypothetical protein
MTCLYLAAVMRGLAEHVGEHKSIFVVANFFILRVLVSIERLGDSSAASSVATSIAAGQTRGDSMWGGNQPNVPTQF